MREFLEAMRKEKYRQSVPQVEAALEKIKFPREHIADAKNNPFALRMEAFLNEGSSWPLMDMLAVVQPLDTAIAECLASDILIVIPTASHTGQESYQEEETYQDEVSYQEKEFYQEEVLIKPGGIFRKPITKMQTKTRMVTKTRPVTKTRGVTKFTRNLEAIRDEIYSVKGELITSIDLHKIPAGQFMMGKKSYYEGEKRFEIGEKRVTIAKDFYLGKYLVTQAQWQAVMDNNPSHFEGDPNLPVETVSWEDCQQFLNKLNENIGKKLYRLPTDAEWEYACRAGSSGNFCFGALYFRNGDLYFHDEKGELHRNQEKLREYGWYKDNSKGKTHPVGQLKPNVWGLYDMHGNVGEWCEDWYVNSTTERVVRDYSWDTASYYSGCDSIFNGYCFPKGRSSKIGFRCARDVC